MPSSGFWGLFNKQRQQQPHQEQQQAVRVPAASSSKDHGEEQSIGVNGSGITPTVSPLKLIVDHTMPHAGHPAQHGEGEAKGAVNGIGTGGIAAPAEGRIEPALPKPMPLNEPAPSKVELPAAIPQPDAAPTEKLVLSDEPALDHHPEPTSITAASPAALSSPEPGRQSFKAFHGVIKPDLDDRSYVVLSLPNGMDALVVSDPTTDRSSAALDVHVGYFSDPEDVPGLAHFLEHLLFLGTEKYPVENDYAQFLSEVGGGYSNAFTSSENTNFFFEVSSEGQAFEGALDRFAQFFIAPLFEESATERELKAVDSEHKKNIQDDMWRLSQLDKDLSSPSHPYRKFGTGCWETLHEMPLQRGLNMRKILLDFHEKYYSANIMKLVVLGKEPLDILTDWVVTKFSPVHNKNIPVPTFAGHPLSVAELGKLIRVKPVKDMQSLELTFPFPDTVPHYRKSPDAYLAHLLGHEAPGSALAVLRARGWANGIVSSVAHAGINFDFFKISIDLTDEGMEHWETIIVIIFQYISMLRKIGVQKWIYDECQTMARLTFRFQEKFSPSDFTSWASQNMQSYDKADILRGYSLMEEFDEELIRSLLDLLRPEHFRVMLVSALHQADHWEKAAWYGTEYVVEDLPKDLLEKLVDPPENEELFLPVVNPYIPQNFDVITPAVAEDYSHPVIIHDSALSRLWYKPDRTFKVPRTQIAFFFRTTNSYTCTRSAVLNRFFVDLVEDSLIEESYNAELAGLYYSFSTLVEGFELRVAGYTDKLSALLQKVIHTMRHLEISPERFTAVKEEIVRSYKNFDNENPDQHASYFMNWILQEKLWTNAEKLVEVGSIEEDEVSRFSAAALQQLHIEGLVMGTVNEDQAKLYMKIVEEGLSLPKSPLRPLPVTARFQLQRTHIIPYPILVKSDQADEASGTPASSQGFLLGTDMPAPTLSRGLAAAGGARHRLISGHTYRRLLPNAENVNNALEYYLQVGDASDCDVRVRLLLLDQIASEPCFDMLRTKEQLGYVVWCGIRSTVFDWGFRFMVQSEKDPMYVEARVEAFIKHLRTFIADMSEEEYHRNVETLVAKLLQTEKNQHEAADRLWNAIKYSGYQFYQSRTDAAKVPKLSKAELVTFIDERIAKGGPFRRKLSVQIWSHHSMAEWKKKQTPGEQDVSVAEQAATVNGTATEHVEDELSSAESTHAPVDEKMMKDAEEGAAPDVEEEKHDEMEGPERVDLVFETDEAVAELKNSWALSRGIVPVAAHSHLVKALN
ncbi:Insulinase (Peptidase M16) [Phlyctochytrium bullatum]|nr:Insulinase (Peptidase M16) [Phlyctochytrium bullatum]